MEKRLVIFSVLATALSLLTGLASADDTGQPPVQKKIQIHELKQISESQPAKQQNYPAKIGKEQDPAPIILRMTIIKGAD